MNDEVYTQAVSLQSKGFYIGPRDPKRNQAFKGKYMVAEQHLDYSTEDASQGGFCVVGDDLNELVELAYNHFFD